MNQQATRLLDRLDAETKDLMTFLNRYDHQALNSNPKPAVFSALQNCEHVMGSERKSQEYLVKKLSFNPELKNAGLASSLRFAVYRAGASLPIKFKAPEFIAQENLPAESEFYEVVKRWTRQREELRTFLGSLPEELWKKELFKHPIAGKMTLVNMLKFLLDHFQRHRKQIKRALKGYQ